MCKGKKSIWIVLFPYLSLDTLKLYVSLGRCCQLEGFSCCQGVSSRAPARAGLLFWKGSCWWLSESRLRLPRWAGSINYSGRIQKAQPQYNHCLICRVSAPCALGLLGCYWALDRKTGVVPGVSQPSNLLLTCSRHVGNWFIKQVKGIFFLRTFSASFKPQFWDFLSGNLPQDYDELISRSIYHTLEIFLPWIFPLLKHTPHFCSIFSTFSIIISPLPSPGVHHRQHHSLLHVNFPIFPHSLNWWVKTVPFFSIQWYPTFFLHYQFSLSETMTDYWNPAEFFSSIWIIPWILVVQFEVRSSQATSRRKGGLIP